MLGNALKIVTQEKNRFEFEAQQGFSRLMVPRQGSMDRIVYERITGALIITLYDSNNKILFKVTGSTVNIELMEAHSLFRFHLKSHNCAINICTMECDESIFFINCDIY